MKLSLSVIGKVVHAENAAELSATQIVQNIEFDTRKLQKDDLFVPLRGSRDGHDFVGQAIEAGAVAVFWSKERTLVLDGIQPLFVADPLIAMQDLARFILKTYRPRVIAITGSNGKTTTKDMTAAVLSAKYATHKTQGNFNNQIGMPYTILHMPEKTEMLVLEMGMDHAGEISFLSELAKPDVAGITMIGESHIEYLGSRAGIAAAKMEIVDGLKSTGLLILPGEEPLLSSYLSDISQELATFGMTDKNSIYPIEVVAQETQTSFKVPRYGDATFTLPVPGKYNVSNALIALLIGEHFAVDVSKMQLALSGFQLTQNRTEWLTAVNGARILSDVYNANPTAMHLVLEHFISLDHKGKKIVVLGDMLELGAISQEAHESISLELKPGTIDKIFLYGNEMRYLYEKLAESFTADQLFYFAKEEMKPMISKLLQELEPEDMILLKGSNGMKLSEVVTALI